MRALVTVTVLVLGLYGSGMAQQLQVPQKYCEIVAPKESKSFFPVPNETTLDQCLRMVRNDTTNIGFFTQHYQAAAMCLGRDYVMRAGPVGKDRLSPPNPDECGWR